MKIISDGKTTCFVSPLNRTNLLDPTKINGPESPVSPSISLSSTPKLELQRDVSYLTTARRPLPAIVVYWILTGPNGTL